jgi:hypothetical protein
VLLAATARRCELAWLWRAIAGAASKAAAISATDKDFSLVIQFLHFQKRSASYGNSELIGLIKGTHYHVASTPREVGVSATKDQRTKY